MYDVIVRMVESKRVTPPLFESTHMQFAIQNSKPQIPLYDAARSVVHLGSNFSTNIRDELLRLADEGDVLKNESGSYFIQCPGCGKGLHATDARDRFTSQEYEVFEIANSHTHESHLASLHIHLRMLVHAQMLKMNAYRLGMSYLKQEQLQTSCAQILVMEQVIKEKDVSLEKQEIALQMIRSELTEVIGHQNPIRTLIRGACV
jgi:hypothetical protein